MIRILHIVPGMNRGGMETFLMNLYRRMDLSRIQFDFLIHDIRTGAFEEEIAGLGGHIYHIGSRRGGLRENRRQLAVFFRLHKEYRIVVQHVSSLSYIAPLKEAAKAAVPVRIIHCHNTKEGGAAFAQPIHRLLHICHSAAIGYIATDFSACSMPAAQFLTDGRPWLMGRLRIVPNMVKLADFAFDEDLRQEVRAEMGLDGDTLLIGNVGRLAKQKNQKFLVRLVWRMRLQDKKVRLLCVGDGEKRGELLALCRRLKLEDSVIFAGECADVRRFYQAMDLFVFPSLYEGLGMALLEAQASGLPCLVSDRVPAEAKAGPATAFLRLEEGECAWAKEAFARLKQYRKDRRQLSEQNRALLSRYDAETAADREAAYYEKLTGRFDNKTHILQVRMDEAECVGGISSYIMNLYRHVDRSRFCFDFLVPAGVNCACREEILALGGNVYPAFMAKRDSVLAHRISLHQFFAVHPEIRIVHGHYGQNHSIAEYLAAAGGGRRLIFHAHSTDRQPGSIYTRLMSRYNRQRLLRCSDALLACSKQAGLALIGGAKFTVVKNGIETRRYVFDASKRRDIRKKLGLEGKRVIGHAGRFVWQKNHEFLLDIFQKVREKDREAVLLLAGAGELEDPIRKKAQELQLIEAVCFLGQRDDMPDFYQAMDLFLFPSRFEGLGIVLLEAQAAGLPCLAASDAVPSEVRILENCHFLPLAQGAETWAQEALALSEAQRETDGAEKVKAAGFDGAEAYRSVEQIYLSLAKEEGLG